MTFRSGLSFQLEIGGEPAADWQLVSLRGSERLSTPAQWTWLIAGHDTVAEPRTWLGRQVRLQCYREGVVQRRLGGEIAALSRLPAGRQRTRWQLQITDPISRLALRSQCRIYQQTDMRQIVQRLLQEHGLPSALFSLRRPLRPREYCVQYHETDLAFLQRLLSEEGCFFFHDWEQPARPLRICDHCDDLFDTGTLQFNAHPHDWDSAGYLSQMQHCWQQTADGVQLRHYHFLTPAAELETRQGEPNSVRQRQLYPGWPADGHMAQRLCQLTYRAEQLSAETCQGRSTELGLRLGGRFTLQQPAVPDADWQPVSIEHSASQAAALEEEPHDGTTEYHNAFTLLPANTVPVCSPLPRPRIDGPQSARVVGPQGESVYCDAYGRIKVQFYWDQAGQFDDHSSCWLRVMQASAGDGFGLLVLPRVGQEVLVQFIDGNPDAPVVIGCVYDALHPLPYALPEAKTRTVLRGRSVGATSGYNELSMEDKAGIEEIRLIAQRDLDIAVKHSLRRQIGLDESSHIAGDSKLHIGGDQHWRVAGNVRAHVTGAYHQSLAGDWVQHTAGDCFHNCDGRMTSQSRDEIRLESAEAITLRVGDSFLRLDHSGITLVGPRIRLNSGGQLAPALTAELVQPLAPDGVAVPELAPPQLWQPDVSQQIRRCLQQTPYLFSC